MSRYHAELTGSEAPGADGAAGTRRLPVVVPHTELPLTEVALREAARLVHGLDARVSVLAVCIVPFPDPLDPTRGLPGLTELMTVAEKAGISVTIQVVYARDWEAACEQVLERGSLVVIAVRRGWLRTREERLARELSSAGHRVTTVFA